MQELTKETNLNPSIIMPAYNSQVNSWEVVEVLAIDRPIIRAFSLLRNYLQDIAHLCGIRRAIFSGTRRLMSSNAMVI